MPARCPTCKKPLEPARDGTRGPSAPFCSERCKMADLARWLRGDYAVPAHDLDEGDAVAPPPDPADE
jgi:endogenous inhibitor of DNA gyrase (YacG/DUF329 family)